MNIIKPSVVLEDSIDGIKIIKAIEKAGRTCYKSDKKITKDSAIPFIKNAIKMGHFSIIEHEKVSATVICDRGVLTEITRHRLGSYSVESTRYVNYKEGIDVIDPIFWPDIKENQYIRGIWSNAMKTAEKVYRQMIEAGAKPEQARTVLPNSLKTEIVMTYNLRAWRHFIWLRGSKGAHIQIRQIACMVLELMQKKIPAVLDDFILDEKNLLIRTDILPAS